jgi:nodulation protein E
MNRVVITGLGVVSALGNTVADFATALATGRSAIGPLANIPTEGLSIGIGAEVRGFDPAALFSDRQLSLYDRNAQFATVAARQAAAQAGVDFRDLGPRGAVILGSGVGGMTTLDDSFHRLYAEGAKRTHPFTIPKLMISAAASHVSIEHGITGPSFTVATACASANHAMGIAFTMLRSGAIEAAMTGGTEAVFTFGTIKGWEALRVMAPDTCRPFSRGRNGMVLGEGAGMFVFETADRALARGAPVIAEVVGFGMSSDAADIVMPAVEGAERAIRACLADAGLAPGDVTYINAHGTGTAANDATETRAIRGVFGAHADRLAVSSTKSMHGHALGAAGAIELAATLVAMRDGFIPATANYLGPASDCDLDYVPNETRRAPIEVALSNSFAFGGHNAVLAVRRFEP